MVSGGRAPSPLTTVEVYDSASDDWTMLPRLPVIMYGGQSITFYNEVFAMCPWNDGGIYKFDNKKYTV